MSHIVLYSGGIGSWAAARRLLEEGHRPTLLFTDTMIEDEDLYRFLDDSSEDLGVPVVRIADGRDPWEVFRDERIIGNTRVDPCSKILKRQLARRWVDDNADPDLDKIAIGIDWSEVHRLPRAIEGWKPYEVIAPMTEPPYMGKDEMISWARDRGLTPPRLYEMGFPHNNCGGFCVKQGQGAFVRLLETMPDRYAYHEAKEEEMREFLDRDVSILRDRTDGTTSTLTLRELRERHEAQPEQLDLLDLGGCNCMV